MNCSRCSKEVINNVSPISEIPLCDNCYNQLKNDHKELSDLEFSTFLKFINYWWRK